MSCILTNNLRYRMAYRTAPYARLLYGGRTYSLYVSAGRHISEFCGDYSFATECLNDMCRSPLKNTII